MSRAKVSTTNLGSRLSDPPANSKILSYGVQDRRNGSAPNISLDGYPARIDDEKAPKTSKDNLFVEARLAQLEKEIAQLVSSTGAARTLSEYDHEQASELDFTQYTPKNEITRISSDEWHEKKGGKFARPEVSVVSVSTTSRYWAGRHMASTTTNRKEDTKMSETSTGDLPLADVGPERPYRLAISGYELHRALEVIFGLPISLKNNVWIWPFKHFITYEPQIKQLLRTEQALICEFKSRHSALDKPNSPIRAMDKVAQPALSRHISHDSEDHEGGEVSEEQQQYDSAVKLEGQLKCLVDFMDVDMKELFSVKQKIFDGTLKSIAFEYLWLLFKPGDLIFTSSAQRRAYRVLHVTGGRAILDIGEQPPLNDRNTIQPGRSWEQHEDQAVTFAHSKNTPFLIDTFYIDFDGVGFGPVPRRFVIQEYAGEHPIDTLPCFPARFEKDIQETERVLAKRGRRFVKMAGVAHKKYNGLSAREKSCADWQEEINSDVVIDFSEAIKYYRNEDPSWEVGVSCGVVDQPSRADRREIFEVKSCSTQGCTLCKTSDIFDDSLHDLERRSDFLDDTTLLRYRTLGKDDLDPDQVILLPPRVYGYSLLDRYWYPLNIDNVEDIKTSVDNGFDDLVLPGDHKRIMQALVKHHSRGPRPTSGKSKAVSGFSADLVRGKGRGLIILLHGVPGVGKTSTAECVAAQTKRPLFPITCGDIGTTASEVEQRLERYFDLAHKWGCVLLLDEADVYLATREKGGDLQRNSLVSVFLRVLEYYSGILILTTNRVGEFDEAFKSRIHISLYYPKLDRKSTIKIWEMNITRIKRSNLNIDIEEDCILQFAEDHWFSSKQKPSQRWNGRQIKNAFQTAIALATWDYNDESDGKHLDRPKLSDKHFDIVSQTSAHFDDYLSKTHQIDEEDEPYGVIAQREGLRNDDVPKINWAGTRRRRASSPVNAKSRRHHRAVLRNGAADSEVADDGSPEASSDDESETKMREEFERAWKRKKRMERWKSSTGKNNREEEGEEEGENGNEKRPRWKSKAMEVEDGNRDMRSRRKVAVEDSSSPSGSS